MRPTDIEVTAIEKWKIMAHGHPDTSINIASYDGYDY